MQYFCSTPQNKLTICTLTPCNCNLNMFWYTAKNNKNHISVQKNKMKQKKWTHLPVSTVIPK